MVTKAAAAEPRFFDAKGGAAETKQAALAIIPGAAPQTRRAYFELHYSGGGVIFEIEVLFNPTTYPFAITGGTIKGSICGSPSWVVTGGSIGPTLQINGSNVCPSPNCASSITVVGKCQCTPSYIGTYGFNGSSNMFKHSTLFLGYDLPR
ncbi:MAG TPA: hypothetical protein VN256_18195 [Pyrinomonadaceae bacterium]|nr:hypothetical protein [Pyrinomonadaceae bacterium]